MLIARNIEKCKNCFWDSVSLKTWVDFEGFGTEEEKEKMIQRIKDRKCKECEKGTDNFSEVWKCENCGKTLSGHDRFCHGSLCGSCQEKQKTAYFKRVNKQL